jgi:hypothetical protein
MLDRHRFIFITLAMLAGCDSSHPLPLSEGPAKIVEADCEHLVRCEETPDMAECKGSAILSMDPVIAAVNAGRIHYDGAAAAQCLDALRKETSCNATDLMAESAAHCGDVFKGTVPTGDTCFMAEECVSGECISQGSCTNTCCSKVCGPGAGTAARVPIGGTCTYDGKSTCVEGSYCSGASDPARCVASVPLGQACDPTSVPMGVCRDMGICTPSDSPLGGTCQWPPNEGEPCGPSVVCNATNDFCNPATGLCTRWAAVGSSCTGTISNECVRYARCDPSTLTCVSLARVGESCDDSQGVTCMDAMTCRNGTCAPPDPLPVCN